MEFALYQLSYDAKNGDQLDVSSGLSEGQLLNFARKAPGVISIATEEPQQVDKIVVIAGPDDDEAPLGMQNGDGSTEIVVWGSEFIEYSAGSYCRALCWGLGSAVCAAVGTSCVVGTVITVGGLAIPCTLAIIASCAASGGAASLCSDACPP